MLAPHLATRGTDERDKNWKHGGDLMDKFMLDGLDPAVLLKHLHNGTHSIGMGVMHDLMREITTEEARADFEAMRQKAAGYGDTWFKFDYYHGRPLKVTFFPDGEVKGWQLYDRDAGAGKFARAVAAAREECGLT
jgi:hypothetical protein